VFLKQPCARDAAWCVLTQKLDRICRLFRLTPRPDSASILLKVVAPNGQHPKVSAVVPDLQWHPKSIKWRQNIENRDQDTAQRRVPETTLRPRHRLKRPWSHLSLFLKDFGTFQASFWMTPGTASGTKFWYPPKAPRTRHNTEHLQWTCEKLQKKRTSKEVAENFRRTSENLQEMQRTYRELARNLPKTKSQKHERRIAFFDATAAATHAEQQNRGRRYSRLRTQINWLFVDRLTCRK
jgi:hypothetical protein